MYPISGYFSKLGAHLTMLSDKERVEFYEKAMKKAIVPGESTVLDIGTGTGILAMIATRCGAKKVYAIECGDIINIAKKIVADNGFDEKIVFVRGLSTEVELPEKVDVIVSETMGFTGLEEDIEKIMLDAKGRFGKEGAILIPDSLNVYVALCSDHEVRDKLIDVWEKPLYDFDYSFLSSLSKQNVFTRQNITKDYVVSNSDVVYSVELGIDAPSGKKAVLIVDEDSVIEGLVGWFSVSSQRDVSLYGSQLNENGHWQQFFVPFEAPIDAKKGDEFEIQLSKEQPFCWNIIYTKVNGRKMNFSVDNKIIMDTMKGLK